MDAETKVAMDIDRAYVEGMKTGWNIAQGLSDVSAYFPIGKNRAIEDANRRAVAQFQAAINSRTREIYAAKQD